MDCSSQYLSNLVVGFSMVLYNPHIVANKSSNILQLEWHEMSTPSKPLSVGNSVATFFRQQKLK